uniref:Uncharacterized protein n=1 Tax=Solanum tuberosum TaxID=4113 RepID=Q60D40_SOLTU|nr:hypothetical protein STB1_54t00008 [Solanum tuberosum]
MGKMNGGKIRLAVIDHITSMPSVVIPVKELVQMCRDEGVDFIFVDGAHAIGNVEIDVVDIGADFYTSNLHKWFFTPPSAAFLYCKRSEKVVDLHHPVVSVEYGNGLAIESAWIGTRDYSAQLVIPDVVESFVNRFEGGIEGIRRRNHDMVVEMAEMLVKAWGTELGTPPEMCSSMAMVGMPACIGISGNSDALKLRTHLRVSFKVEVPIYYRAPLEGEVNPITGYARISHQVYNTIVDYFRFRDVIIKLTKKNMVTLFLNQRHQANTMFDHDSNPGHPQAITQASPKVGYRLLRQTKKNMLIKKSINTTICYQLLKNQYNKERGDGDRLFLNVAQALMILLMMMMKMLNYPEVIQCCQIWKMLTCGDLMINLEIIVERLRGRQSDQNIFTISGMGGIGKTTLARKTHDHLPIRDTVAMYADSNSPHHMTILNLDNSWKLLCDKPLSTKRAQINLKTMQPGSEVWRLSDDDKFKSLKLLLFSYIYLEHWEICSDSFPNLKRLVLRKCKCLPEIPTDFGEICTLESIELHECSRAAEDFARKK